MDGEKGAAIGNLLVAGVAYHSYASVTKKPIQSMKRSRALVLKINGLLVNGGTVVETINFTQREPKQPKKTKR